MQDSQSSNKTSDPILSKLIEADSELTTQEAELRVQLETIQEKRKGLKTVISMFSPEGASSADLIQQLGESLPARKTNGSAVSVEDAATPSAIPPALIAEGDAATNGAVAIAEELTEDETPASFTADTEAAAKQPNRRTSDKAKTTKEPTAQSRGGRIGKAAKPPRKSLGWQQYIRDEFGKSSLAEAIPQVLERQPDEVLETAEIINAIFVEDIPKDVRSTVRERVSNILSSGLKVNKWYRGRTGCYSISKSAAEASLAS